MLFQPKCKLINFFTFGDKIHVFLRFGIVYKFKCGNCNATHYVKTRRHLEFGRTLEFLLLLQREIKWITILNNPSPDFDDFPILASNNNDFMVSLMENLLIKRNHPPLNKNWQSLPLELFDN